VSGDYSHCFQRCWYVQCRDRDVAAASDALGTLPQSTRASFHKAFSTDAATALNEDVTAESPSGQMRHTVLCPHADVVALTAKPAILAATKGPLSPFFAVPEHLSLSTEGKNASLQGMRAFADYVGYPVVVKGVMQGAAVCDSWAAVRATVTTQAWAQGGFLQRHVRGWERCLAFAAYDGTLLGKVDNRHTVYGATIFDVCMLAQGAV
jgi:hypothetical protein